MDILNVIVIVTVVILSAVAANIVEPIGQWVIKNIIKPVAQWLMSNMVTPVGQRLNSYTGESVGQWLGYSFHYTRNIENMKKKVEELEARKKEQSAIDASGGNCEEIKQYVKSWLAEVNEIMGKAKDLVIEDDKRVETTGSY